MPNKTQGVHDLVAEVLESLPRPYGEDVIEDVCLAIDGRPRWKWHYNCLKQELTKEVVNNWIGQYTKQITDMDSITEVDAKRSKIIVSYTKLRPKRRKRA